MLHWLRRMAPILILWEIMTVWARRLAQGERVCPSTACRPEYLVLIFLGFLFAGRVYALKRMDERHE